MYVPLSDLNFKEWCSSFHSNIFQVAEEHYSLALQRKCLLSWFRYSQEALAVRTAQADQLYSQLLCRRVLQSWFQVRAQGKDFKCISLR